MLFQCINIHQISWEVLKTAAFGLGFQHLPRDLANVNAWKTMFDPYTENLSCIPNTAILTESESSPTLLLATARMFGE